MCHTKPAPQNRSYIVITLPTQNYNKTIQIKLSLESRRSRYSHSIEPLKKLSSGSPISTEEIVAFDNV